MKEWNNGTMVMVMVVVMVADAMVVVMVVVMVMVMVMVMVVVSSTCVVSSTWSWSGVGAELVPVEAVLMIGVPWAVIHGDLLAGGHQILDCERGLPHLTVVRLVAQHGVGLVFRFS
eukprot:COSAG01_NODE_1146_length_11522_cov_103.027916_13_plen_116_part_00